MSVRNTIVNYSQISRAIKNHEAVRNSTQEQTEKIAANPVEAGMMLTGLAAALDELEALEKHSDVLTSPDHEVAALLQSYLAERANAEGKLQSLPSGLEEARFDEHDLTGWFGSFFTWWRQLNKHDWIQASPTPEPVGNQIRGALLGDWGTGLYGAPESAKAIEQAHARAIANGQDGYNLLIHLGDVYYAGNKGEVEERFLQFWPKVDLAINRAVNSNHEMYTGGHGYFNLTLERFQQSASYFALQNDYWTLVGLDSAYKNPHQGGLTEDQVEWLRGIINQADQRKVILFSHHQAFAWLETAKNKVAAQLSEFLSAKKIFAWYWGHEHRCIIYDRHPGWELYGRCVGHSGYPYFKDKLDHLTPSRNFSEATWRQLPGKNLVPGGLVLDDPNPYIEGHAEDYGAQGHMTLEFDGDQLTEIVHLPDGTRIYERPLGRGE